MVLYIDKRKNMRIYFDQQRVAVKSGNPKHVFVADPIESYAKLDTGSLENKWFAVSERAIRLFVQNQQHVVISARFRIFAKMNHTDKFAIDNIGDKGR